MAKRIALKNFGGWLAVTIGAATVYRFVVRESMETPVILAMVFALFVITPVLYLLMRQYEQLEE